MGTIFSIFGITWPGFEPTTSSRTFTEAHRGLGPRSLGHSCNGQQPSLTTVLRSKSRCSWLLFCSCVLTSADCLQCKSQLSSFKFQFSSRCRLSSHCSHLRNSTVHIFQCRPTPCLQKSILKHSQNQTIPQICPVTHNTSLNFCHLLTSLLFSLNLCFCLHTRSCSGETKDD